MKTSSSRVFRPALGAVLALAACILLLTGCVNVVEMSRTTPAQLGAETANDRSPSLHSGDDFAYWVWKDSDGTWHLRTTAAVRKPHHFQGRIHPLTPGTIAGLTRIGLEDRRRRGDLLTMTDGDIAFAFFTRGDEDGLDFRLNGSAPLEFDLRIDGDGDPGKIYLGKNLIKPANSHFLLCP